MMHQSAATGGHDIAGRAVGTRCAALSDNYFRAKVISHSANPPSCKPSPVGLRRALETRAKAPNDLSHLQGCLRGARQGRSAGRIARCVRAARGRDLPRRQSARLAAPRHTSAGAAGDGTRMGPGTDHQLERCRLDRPARAHRRQDRAAGRRTGRRSDRCRFDVGQSVRCWPARWPCARNGG